MPNLHSNILYKINDVNKYMNKIIKLILRYAWGNIKIITMLKDKNKMYARLERNKKMGFNHKVGVVAVLYYWGCGFLFSFFYLFNHVLTT
jgi:hypothetical protein